MQLDNVSTGGEKLVPEIMGSFATGIQPMPVYDFWTDSSIQRYVSPTE